MSEPCMWVEIRGHDSGGSNFIERVQWRELSERIIAIYRRGATARAFLTNSDVLVGEVGLHPEGGRKRWWWCERPDGDPAPDAGLDAEMESRLSGEGDSE